MAFLGILANVAAVGLNLLGGVLMMSDEERSRRMGVVTLEGGAKLRVYAKHLLVHPDRNMVGRGAAFTPFEEGEVGFSIAERDDGTQGVFAFNNNKTKDYCLNFTTTAGKGVSGNLQFNLPHAQQPGVPNFADVSTPMQDYAGGGVVATPAEVADTTNTFAAEKKKGLHNTGELSVLSNWNFTSVVGTAKYTLYSDALGAAELDWAQDDTTITGFTIYSTVRAPIAVTVNLHWSNPTNASSVTVNVPAYEGDWFTGPPATPVQGTFGPNDRPISSVEIAVVSPKSDAFKKDIKKVGVFGGGGWHNELIGKRVSYSVDPLHYVNKRKEEKGKGDLASQLSNLFTVYEEQRVQLEKLPGVSGVSVGVKSTGGKLTQNPCLVFYVPTKMSNVQVLASGGQLLPTHIDSRFGKVAVDVQQMK